MTRLGWILWCLIALSSTAQAHIASNGFLNLQVADHQIKGSIELAVRDAELAVGVDLNHDGTITWAELRASASRVEAYFADHLEIDAQGSRCAISLGALAVNRRVDGVYAWMPVTVLCSASIHQLQIRYTAMQDLDPSHRGLLNLTSGEATHSLVLGGEQAVQIVDVSNPSRWRTFVQYLQAGVWHILSGIDHLLFLLSLLLPSVLLRRERQWEPVATAGPAFLGILKVVTAFTVAHSITLGLAAFNVIRLPSRLTESVIAASIIVAAVNNIFPLVTAKRARIAFAFGLLHGFGFASVLSDMGLPSGARLLSLFGFNLGIECGQLAVVLTVMPLVYLVRRETVYRRVVMPFGSAVVALIAAVWLGQRAFAL